MKKTESLSGLLQSLFRRLDSENVLYCVLRNYEGLPSSVGNDVDLLVSPHELDRFEVLFLNAARSQDWVLVRCVKSFGFRKYYLQNRWVPHSEGLHLDAFSPINWRGTIWVSSDYVLSHRIRNGIFYIPCPGNEAVITLLKDFLQDGNIKAKYKARICELAKAGQEDFRACVKDFLTEGESLHLLQSAMASDWEGLVSRHASLRMTLVLRSLKKAPAGQLVNWLRYGRGYLCSRFLKPTGFVLVILGPDGAGKTTVITKLPDTLNTLFPIVKIKKFRPGILPELRSLRLATSRIIKRRSKSDREYVQYLMNAKTAQKSNPLVALFRLSYYTLDFLLGHIPFWLFRVNGDLVIFDRYYYDYLVHQPWLGVPNWLVRVFARIIPQPDAIIYLCASPQQIFHRKQELAEDEIQRQMTVYAKIMGGLPNGFVVDTTGGADDVVNKTGRVVLHCMSKRAESSYSSISTMRS